MWHVPSFRSFSNKSFLVFFFPNSCLYGMTDCEILSKKRVYFVVVLKYNFNWQNSEYAKRFLIAKRFFLDISVILTLTELSLKYMWFLEDHQNSHSYMVGVDVISEPVSSTALTELLLVLTCIHEQHYLIHRALAVLTSLLEQRHHLHKSSVVNQPVKVFLTHESNN